MTSSADELIDSSDFHPVALVKKKARFVGMLDFSQWPWPLLISVQNLLRIFLDGGTLNSSKRTYAGSCWTSRTPSYALSQTLN